MRASLKAHAVQWNRGHRLDIPRKISWSAKLTFDLHAQLLCVQFVITVRDQLKIADTNFILANIERDI